MLKYHSPRWLVAYNSSNYQVPAYGIVEVNGAAYDSVNAEGPTLQLRIDRPSESSAAHIAINSFLPIDPGKTGLVTVDGPALIATTATFVAGDPIGSVADSFVPAANQTGLVMLADMGDGKFLVDKSGGSGGKKPKCRFVATASLGTSDPSVGGSIENKYGFSWGSDQYGSGALHTTLTGLTFYNLLTHTTDVYEFTMDSGDAGIASYSGVGTIWVIDIPECP